MEDSRASNPALSLSYAWSFDERPQGSNLSISTPGGIETGFRFDSTKIGVDVAGRFILRGTVIDQNGTSNVNDCSVAFESIPSDSFLVQLTWGSAINDMDLHLLRRNNDGLYCLGSVGSGDPAPEGIAQMCDNGFTALDDCHFGNCRTGLDWDDSGMSPSAGDPSLDVDDTSSFGPENINIDETLPGSYLVGAATFGGGGPELNLMRVFLFGGLAGEWFADLSGTFWEVAIVHWGTAGGRPCLEDLTDGVDNDCGCVDGPIEAGTLGLCSCWENLRSAQVECP
jgi:hypothetical protein